MVLALPDDEVQLPAADRAQTVLDRTYQSRRDAPTPRIGVRGDVIHPAPAAIEASERRRDEAIAFAADDAESGVARCHRRERRIVIARPVADAARAPQRPKLVAVTLAKVAYLHRRPY